MSSLGVNVERDSCGAVRPARRLPTLANALAFSNKQEATPSARTVHSTPLARGRSPRVDNRTGNRYSGRQPARVAWQRWLLLEGRASFRPCPLPYLKKENQTPPFKNTLRLFLVRAGQGLWRPCKRPFQSVVSQGTATPCRPAGDRRGTVSGNPRLWRPVHAWDLERESMQTNL